MRAPTTAIPHPLAYKRLTARLATQPNGTALVTPRTTARPKDIVAAIPNPDAEHARRLVGAINDLSVPETLAKESIHE